MSASRRSVQVAVPIPEYRTLTYCLSKSMLGLGPGMRVVVPVGPKRRMIGIVWDDDLSGSSEYDGELKEIEGVLDNAPLLSRQYRKFITDIADYYFFPLGLTLEEALPAVIFSSKNKSIESILSARHIPTKAKTPLDEYVSRRPVELTDQQGHVLGVITERLQSGDFSPILLHGVTGSGKTEIYIRAAQEAISRGKSVLVLVPEIGLATQLIAWFKEALGKDVGIWHSRMTSAQKLATWDAIKSGETKVVVGVRSAIFAPLEGLGLIVVDEEHEGAYKQESRLRYNARDLAILKGKIYGATVVLGSATPSLVTYYNAQNGGYTLLRLSKRVFQVPLPQVEVVDMRDNRANASKATPWWMSSELKSAIEETLEEKGQCLLFLNRRGFAPFVFCTDCGHVFKCPHCELALTLHKGCGTPGSRGRLLCHTCGFTTKALPLCPQCHGVDLDSKGLGTEQILQGVLELFPNVRAERFDRDTLGSKKRYSAILKGFREGHIDILVGTQMVTKGFDFPNLSLVGVIWGDQSLHYPSFNASERTFQLLTQVAGRAGRRERRGRVVIQTYQPGHYALVASSMHDYESFAQEELKRRRPLHYPPYGRLVTLIFSGKKEESVKRHAFFAQKIAKDLEAVLKRRYTDEIEILGPSPGVRPKIRDTYYWNLLIKGSKRGVVRAIVRGVLRELSTKKKMGVRLEIDCDPVGLA